MQINLLTSFNNRLILALLLFLSGIYLWFPPKTIVLLTRLESQPKLLPIAAPVHDAVWDQRERIIKATGSDPYFWPYLFAKDVNIPKNFLSSPLAALRMKIEPLTRFNEKDFQVYFVPADKPSYNLGEKNKSLGVVRHIDKQIEITWQFPVLISGGRIDIPVGANFKIIEFEYSLDKSLIFGKKIREVSALISIMFAVLIILISIKWNYQSFFTGVMERRVLGVTAMMFFVYLVYYNLNVFSNFPSIIWIFSTVIIGIVLLEYLKPWWGFYVFLALWPSMWIVREVMANVLGLHWNALPEFWGGPVAIALTIGCWLRFERIDIDTSVTRYLQVIHKSKHGKWLLAFRTALWGLIASYFFSCVVSIWRLRYHLDGWVIPNDGKQAMLATTLAYVPSLLLGLLLLNYSTQKNIWQSTSISSNELKQSVQIRKTEGIDAIPHIKMILFAVGGGVMSAIFFIYQVSTGFVWNFINSGAPHAGSFFNQNTTAPFFMTMSLLNFAMVQPPKRKQIVFMLLGCFFALLTFMTQSRNGVFMFLCLLLTMPLIQSNWKRFKAFALVSFFSLFLLVWLPLPRSETIYLYNYILSRVIQTIESMRSGDIIAGLLSERLVLFKTALFIFKDFPWFGSGPGTFGMLMAEGARFGNVMGGIHITSPHSMPFHLLAETGLLGVVSWSLAWLLFPLLAVIRWSNGNWFALTALVLGLGNLFDTVWMVPGMTTFCVLLIVWALAAAFQKSAVDKTY